MEGGRLEQTNKCYANLHRVVVSYARNWKSFTSATVNFPEGTWDINFDHEIGCWNRLLVLLGHF